MTDKNKLQTLINQFSGGDLRANSIALFKELGYQSPRTFNKPVAEILRGFDHEKALCSEWINAPFLFQLAEDNLSNIQSLLTEVDGTIIESYMFVAIELEKSEYSRTQLVTITRELNKSPQPVLILFKHGETLTLSVIHRRLHKRDESKDVLEKVTLLKDIRISDPHRAHVDILEDLAFDNLNLKAGASFVDLHNAWQAVLDTKTLNKQFYKELSQWYFWAMKEVYFPDAEQVEAVKGGVFEDDNKVREHNAKSLIRLLTRLLFVWFIKEKNLIPEQLFNEDWIASQLSGFKPKKTDNPNATFQANDSHFYRAILQNLFFATLNQTCEKRQFRNDGQHRNVTNLMRYKSYFSDPDAFLKLVSDVVPFMNGGLFDCLDKPIPELKGKQGGDVIAYEDGFSDRSDNKLRVPDYIFFGSHKNIDLSEELGNKQKSVEIKGLVDILKSYKFTITENTPIEEDIALDPELLGQVFENLLASYNPETKTTARKQTGSFYTPREIVDYMVDESLKAYFKSKLEHLTTEQLDALLSYSKSTPEFSEEDKTALIEAIDTCKILDPACGSGAFPMGVLHKLVFVISKLDENNDRWKARQLARVPNSLKEQVKEAFVDNEIDYARKLYLIENCIYGVDIQAIAIQISKLRFFISLIVDQKIDNQKPNFGVLPLPNLETKFVAANTLIDIEKPKKQTSLFDSKEIEALEEKLKKVRHSLFSVRSPSRKRELREEDKLLREQIGELLEQHGWGNETAQQLAHWNPYDQNANADFFNLEWMFGLKNGFDIVIGNPPYLRVQGLDEKDKKEYAKRFQSATGAYDLYVLFTEKGLQLLNPKGILNFIQPDKWVNASLGKGLRKTTANYIQKLISFKHHQVFNASTYSALLWITKEKQQQMLYSELDRDLPDNNDLNNWLRNLNTDDFTANNNENLSEEAWVFTKPEASKILKKLAKQPRKIKDVFDRIFTGLQTSKDDVYFLENCYEEDGFIVGDSKALEKQVKVEKGLVKPLLKGDNVHRWENLKLENYVIFPYHVELKEYQNEVSLMPEKFIVDNFELGLNYLKSNENALKMREKGNFDNEQWYQFSRNQGIRFEGKPKLLCRDICQKSQFTFDEDGTFYTTTTVYGYIKYPHIKEDYRFFLAILNSFVTWYFMQNTSAVLSGGYYRYMPRYVSELPIPKIPESEQQPFIKLVDYILFIKKQPFYTTTDLDFAEERLMSNFFENLIDALVYELYFPEELHEAKKQFMSLVVQENLPDLNAIEGDKVGALKQIVRRLTDKNHPLYNNLFFLDSVPVVRIIEGKA